MSTPTVNVNGAELALTASRRTSPRWTGCATRA